MPLTRGAAVAFSLFSFLFFPHPTAPVKYSARHSRSSCRKNIAAPVPYLIGLPTNEMGDLNINRQTVTTVDLDTNTVTLATAAPDSMDLDRIPAAVDTYDLPQHEEDVLRRELRASWS